MLSSRQREVLERYDDPDGGAVFPLLCPADAAIRRKLEKAGLLKWAVTCAVGKGHRLTESGRSALAEGGTTGVTDE